MSAPGEIDISYADGVATMRLRNPARRNAVSSPMWRAIAGFASGVGERRDVRAVVIRGDGDVAFCAGADVTDFSASRAGANTRGYDDLVESTCQAIEAIPQPTLALVIGACMGAGCSLAASCDLRIASDDAFFAVPAARLGLGYDPRGLRRFLRVFGPGATRELILTGERMSAARACELGALARVAAKADAERLASAWAENLSANAPLTMTAAKTAMRALQSGDAGLLVEAERLYEAADASEDYAEGRRAFAEKRRPRFIGA